LGSTSDCPEGTGRVTSSGQIGPGLAAELICESVWQPVSIMLMLASTICLRVTFMVLTLLIHSLPRHPIVDK
jgi:hypothetical protein